MLFSLLLIPSFVSEPWDGFWWLLLDVAAMDDVARPVTMADAMVPHPIKPSVNELADVLPPVLVLAIFSWSVVVDIEAVPCTSCLKRILEVLVVVILWNEGLKAVAVVLVMEESN